MDDTEVDWLGYVRCRSCQPPCRTSDREQLRLDVIKVVGDVHGLASQGTSAVRIKDNCQFICEEDPDGMPLDTLDGESFLSINGIQTLSHTYINYLEELADMRAMGISHFRIVPHTQDMVAVAHIFRDTLDDKIDAVEAERRLAVLEIPAPFSNGFWHGKPGFNRVSVS